MTQNSNLGYTGFLLRKTIQPSSLRSESQNFNDFRENNVLLYINKKVSNTREREGKHIPAKALQKGISLPVHKGSAASRTKAGPVEDEQNYLKREEANIQALIKEDEKEQKDPFYREIMQAVNNDKYEDDFVIVSDESKIQKPNQNRKQRHDIEQTLNVLVANNIESEKVKELFRDYKKVSLKDKLNELKSRKLNMVKIQKKIKSDENKIQTPEDSEKINQFMGRLCTAKNITIGKLLQIKEEDIQYKANTGEVETVPKVKALKMLEEFMEDEEDENEKNLIKIFKKTQIDMLDPDASKGKRDMTSFKKKNLQTQKLYKEMAQNKQQAILNAMMDPQQNPNKFVRIKNNIKAPNEKINVFKRLGQLTAQSNKGTRPHQFAVPTESLITEKDITHEHIQNIFFGKQQSRFLSSPDCNQQMSEYSIDQHALPTRESLLLSTNSLHKSSSIPLASARLSSAKNARHYNSTMINNYQAEVNLKKFSKADKMTASHQKNTLAKEILPINKLELVSQLPQQQSYHFMSNNRSESFNNETDLSMPEGNQETHNERYSQRVNTQGGRAERFKAEIERKEAGKKIQNFMKQCTLVQAQKQQSETSIKLDELEEIVSNQMDEISLINKGQSNVEAKIDNPNFVEYLKRSEFKRNLISFLVQKVDKKSDLYSKFQSKQFTQNFFAKLSEKEPGQATLNE